VNDKGRALNALQAVVNKLNSANVPTLFFSLLRESAELLLQNPAFKEGIEMVIDRGKRALKHLTPLEKEALDELKTHENKIRDYVTHKGVANQSIIQLLDTFKDRSKKCSRLHRMLLVPLEQAIYILLNDETCDHHDFMQTFGKINRINDDKHIATAEAFPKFDIWEKETSYVTQRMQTTDWHSLNQIMVFFERYDFRHYDNLNIELIKSGNDVTKLNNEHSTLITHTILGKALPSNLFPTIEEYKYYMTKLVESIQEVITSISSDEIKIHAYVYSPSTGELKIDNDEPIKYKINGNPAKLLKEINQRGKSKPLSFTAAYNALKIGEHGFVKKLGPNEVKQIRAIIRQVNDQLVRVRKPIFFISQRSKSLLREQEIFISSSYKSL
jgi:hypothetical protein